MVASSRYTSCYLQMIQAYSISVLEEKLCRLVSEFGRVGERTKLRVNEDKSKVMR